MASPLGGIGTGGTLKYLNSTDFLPSLILALLGSQAPLHDQAKEKAGIELEFTRIYKV